MSNAPKHAPLSVTVVVMAFNENDSLATVVAEIRDALTLLQTEWEILIVDDGSDDGTAAKADLLSDGIRIRVVHHGLNRGLGEVYRTGFDEARMACITFFPADGQFPATIISQFLNLMPSHDLVLGYLEARSDPALARFLSWGQRVVYRILAGPLPRFQGVLMVRPAFVQGLSLKSRGRPATIVFEMLLRAVRERARLASVPTPLRPRLHGMSKVNNLRTVISNLKQAVALRRILSD